MRYCFHHRAITALRTSNEGTALKLASNTEHHWGPATKLLMGALRSKSFLLFLEALTGISGLIPDPTYTGSGLHQTKRGGRLRVHADFNRLGYMYQLDRRLNSFVYLNEGWRPAWNGHLELWDAGMEGPPVSIGPAFGRFVVFRTTDFSYHGHPAPWLGPEGHPRRSAAMYYYTNGGQEAVDVLETGSAPCALAENCVPVRHHMHTTLWQGPEVTPEEVEVGSGV